ncbi:hypothetical protein AvCA_00460 [Azotobacter vinelandii CA]|uniref:Uncharacterized protein n=2 Tax=Azotobacter vinelandii TaxID=354 RepID=C1DFY6_AZOVD|nr:ABC transporter substrate-binding protein [Azotobacter vinelandii]ACO76313.1 conserved hypothetical protein [Azotobacter vinelandii DJ]AGK15714.1 hypothetical protein AvCA_00460 [Azotobacter vinelandii CA]AGK19029.1 hypothetical protein AvCA6_00460 [Azotobacter vinelandii CA6]WKN22098.1 ABC transporter substrate-binding protein [Azotobacter vinelandii]SFX30029.1 extracellular solute-binding protein [Azotobacter vinelandii]
MMLAEQVIDAEEPVFPEEEWGATRRLDFYGQNIPPLARAMRRLLAEHFRRRQLQPAWYVTGPFGNEPYRQFSEVEDADDLPALIADAGPRAFGRPAFAERWAGVYAARRQAGRRAEFVQAGLYDPADIFQTHGCSCWLILADEQELAGRPLPTAWCDLFAPRYERSIVLNGDGDLPARLLLANLAHDHGAAAMTALGRNTRAIRSGGEMGRAAGSHSPERAALYVLPWFWARNNIHTQRTRILWPRDGAYVTPLVSLGRRELSPGAQAALDFLGGPLWAATMESVDCVVADPRHARAPLPGPLRWTGWEPVRSAALDDLVASAAAHFRQGFHA